MNYALPNYYLDKSQEPWYYRRCAISCELCIDKADKCTKCNYKDIYFPLVDNSYACRNNCLDYYWKNFILKECSFCHISCKKCSDDTPVCQVIFIFYLLKIQKVLFLLFLLLFTIFKINKI